MAGADSADHRLRGLRCFAALGAAAVLHCSIGVYLYSRLFVAGGAITEPYWFTFVAPFAVGMAAYAAVLLASPYLRFHDMPTRVAPYVVRYALAVVLALLATFTTSWVYFAIAANTYGS